MTYKSYEEFLKDYDYIIRYLTNQVAPLIEKFDDKVVFASLLAFIFSYSECSGIDKEDVHLALNHFLNQYGIKEKNNN